MLPIISFLLDDTLQISINWPCHMLDCSYKFSILYFISSFRYIARPPCALHVLPTEIKWYPSILSSDVRRVNLRLNQKKMDTKVLLVDSGRICHVN